MDLVPVVDASKFPDLIGRVVVVQVFTRSGETELNVDSLKKYVGYLQGYSTGEKYLTLSIQGLPLIYIPTASEYVEIFEVRKGKVHGRS